jgi:hypothetical protein
VVHDHAGKHASTREIGREVGPQVGMSDVRITGESIHDFKTDLQTGLLNAFGEVTGRPSLISADLDKPRRFAAAPTERELIDIVKVEPTLDRLKKSCDWLTSCVEQLAGRWQ